ncbi:MAG: glucose/arabinose dehydrogenase, partial [Cryomorphaceae bacterium]
MKRFCTTLFALILTVVCVAQTEDFSIDHETVLSGISSATTITHAGDERIFATEQPGRIRVFYRDGTLESEPFIDIQSRVQDAGGEQGLLGLAFEPDFCESGRFYVNYTADDGGLVTRISRFSVDEDNPMIGDPDSEEILIQFDQDFGNHNGGHIEFGSDGFLYIGTGDGGSGGDPNNRAQNITSYLGKMLRIDVSPETGYDIPLDNPYIFDDFGQDEIWSYGLRNPWKFAFDRQSGDMYIADVGQNAFEEVNFESADAEGGLNYGWRCYEGDS